MSAETADRLAAVRERIARAAARAGRNPDEITLVGVSKRKSADDVVQAVRAGLRHVGENYMQEARAKIPAVGEALAGLAIDPPRWHFIGRLQSNKANRAVELFDVVETLDRTSLGEHLNRRAGATEGTLDVLVEVNLSGEPQKAGVDPEHLPELLAESVAWKHLRLVGLMAIPEASDDPEQVRPAFARLRELRGTLRGRPGCESLTELSMGMSADFEVAIEEGATLVRVGTAIFGPRK